MHLTAADGLEGVRIMLDPRRKAVVRPNDRHDVVTPALVQQVVPVQEYERGRVDSSLFLRRHGFDRLSLAPGLHFDENKRVAIPRSSRSHRSACGSREARSAFPGAADIAQPRARRDHQAAGS